MDWLAIATDQDIPILKPGLCGRATLRYTGNEHAVGIRNTNPAENDAVNQYSREQIHKRTCKQYCQAFPRACCRQPAGDIWIVLAFRADKSSKRQPIESEAGALPREQGQRARSGQANTKLLHFNFAPPRNDKVPEFVNQHHATESKDEDAQD